MATAGIEAGRTLGLLLVACANTGPGAVTRFAEHVRAACPGRPVVRVADTEFAIIVATLDAGAARSEAAELVAMARAAGSEAWCGYAAPASGWRARELFAAAEAALGYARRVGPGTVIG